MSDWNIFVREARAGIFGELGVHLLDLYRAEQEVNGVL